MKFHIGYILHMYNNLKIAWLFVIEMERVLCFLRLYFYNYILNFLFVKQYNLLQKLTVEIKEARANIIVAYEKKVAIVNQFTGLVNEYDDYEKLIQLKVSDNFVDMARETAKAVQNITALANQFPELKANTQYSKFLEAISENETFISNKRENL